MDLWEGESESLSRPAFLLLWLFKEKNLRGKTGFRKPSSPFLKFACRIGLGESGWERMIHEGISHSVETTDAIDLGGVGQLRRH